tara:strand:- start:443 stop:1141 length:699 start_codon:yes stop_codon:yes gene_type:complete
MKDKSYRAESGRQAKADGHSSEHILCDILSKKTGHMHTVDGGTRTKRDILCEELEKYYSIKSPSNKNTQVHLTPTKVWCEYFNIQGDLRKWFDMFFGLPNTGRSGRKGASEIPSHLNTLALNWFNDNKMEIFNVIVVKGAFKSNNKIEAGKSINQVIWFNKKTNEIEKEVSVEFLSNLVKNGRWKVSKNDTVLHFFDQTDNKLFHLQMKGSGNKSQKNNMQFHIYKPPLQHL